MEINTLWPKRMQMGVELQSERSINIQQPCKDAAELKYHKKYKKSSCVGLFLNQ
jgi:hypothetical protein